MSVLDDFARIRLYRERASQFDLLADAQDSPSVRLRYRVIASHYRRLADREEQADKARMADRVEQLRLLRQQSAVRASLSQPFLDSG
jgi:hypothetical protein